MIGLSLLTCLEATKSVLLSVYSYLDGFPRNILGITTAQDAKYSLPFPIVLDGKRRLSRTRDTGEFTQQDGGKKRTAKRLYVTNVTGLLLACFFVIFT